MDGCVYGCPTWRSVGQPDFRNARFVQVGTYNRPAFVSGSDNGRGFDSLLHHQTTPKPPAMAAFVFVRPAGRIRFEVKVLCSPGKGKSKYPPAKPGALDL